MSTAVQDIEDIQGILKRWFPSVEADGDIGRITLGALHEIAVSADPDETDARKEIQGILAFRFPDVKADGIFGPITYSAIAALDESGDHESMVEKLPTLPTPNSGGWHQVIASSFADPADVRAFEQCKARGGSDNQCFKVGDNGIGKWGANCATFESPYVALPREIWRAAGKTGGAMVILRLGGNPAFAAQLGDTMPSLDNIKNGAGMDTNPAVAWRFGKTPPYMLPDVFWKWG